MILHVIVISRDTVIPYNPDESPLYKAITTVRGESKMPPDQPISQESRTKIRIWIEQGAKYRCMCRATWRLSVKAIINCSTSNLLNMKRLFIII